MANFAYIRVSDDTKQNGETQSAAIREYCNGKSLVIDQWLEVNASGSKTSAEQRGVAQLINQLQPGDRIIMTEISRLGRDKVLGLISLINDVTEAGAELHLAYTNQAVTPANVDCAEILFTVVGASFVAKQEAQRRSERAKAACNRRKGEGLHNGRRKGLLVKSKLDQYEDRIVRAINDEIPKAHIARTLDVGRSTLLRWLESRDRIRSVAIDNFDMPMTASLTEMKEVLNKQEQLPL